jgi:hypothetical protein|tara:strand:- start:24 stop:185 length:162 start_codon:yes stop_codon:yes gene_type:complete
MTHSKTYQIVLTLEVVEEDDIDKRVYSYLKELMDDNSLYFEEIEESVITEARS